VKHPRFEKLGLRLIDKTRVKVAFARRDDIPSTDGEKNQVKHPRFGKLGLRLIDKTRVKVEFARKKEKPRMGKFRDDNLGSSPRRMERKIKCKHPRFEKLGLRLIDKTPFLKRV
jgi:hypothetical protein